MNMKFLVIGCGSIGKRHIKNLKTLGITNITACDINRKRLQEIEDEFNIKTCPEFEQVLKTNPDVVLICTSPHLHIPIAIAAAQKDCHLFIEKPLSHTMYGIEELISIVEQKTLVTLVGCNMRFHTGIAKIKELLEKKSIGKVISARVQVGQYLPDWHPQEDYRQSYSAKESMGGGIILDGIHELDYIHWLLGEVKKVFCFSGKLSSLEIDTEDTTEILLTFNSGTIAEIHLDYIQRSYSRSCQIIGEEGTILWDFKEGQVKLFTTADDWQVFPQPEDYNVNRMYIDEMKHFLDCINGKAQSTQDIKEGKKALEIALSAKKSAKTGNSIKLGNDK
jgi:predicted dehydrogenase